MVRLNKEPSCIVHLHYRVGVVILDCSKLFNFPESSTQALQIQKYLSFCFSVSIELTIDGKFRRQISGSQLGRIAEGRGVRLFDGYRVSFGGEENARACDSGDAYATL